jgi:GTP-binding protein Era
MLLGVLARRHQVLATMTVMAVTEPPPGHRAGFGCFVGRPNVGKSTLMNALVGEKVAITSERPQTTRHAVRAVVNRPGAQLVIVDTPGFHRPRTLLGERLNDLVRSTISDVDVVGFCVPADEKVGPGDRFIANELVRSARRTPVVGIVTKTDRAARDVVGERLLELSELGPWDAVVPVSATSGYQLETLADLLVGRLPASPALYDEDEVTDEPVVARVAELVREAALDGVREELPHSIAAVTEEVAARSGRDDLIDVSVVLFVERESQKGIVIGAGGSRLREIGVRARREIEALLGASVYLDLRVKVAKDWQRDAKQLRRLGF